MALLGLIAAGPSVPAAARVLLPAAGCGNRAATVKGLDHVPVAVADLDEASRRYRRMGFVLKEGRPHNNGIRNRHIKFPDGTEIELITTDGSGDALAAEYRRFMRGGDGPAFLALYVPSLRRVSAVLDSAGLKCSVDRGMVSFSPGDPLRYIFFGLRNRSGTDLPDHFDHPNTAESLTRVWLAADDFDMELLMFSALGLEVAAETVLVPGPVPAGVVSLDGGELLLLPGSHQRTGGRRVVGVTVRVRDIGAAIRYLHSTGVGFRLAKGDRKPRSVFLAPDLAHGLWIELRGPE